MEQELLHTLLIFFAGLILGVLLMMLINKLRSGSASAGKVKQEFDDYQAQVESHFEETSQKFKDMTQQYQDLYKHLSVGATSLCRPDSVAATGLANQSEAVSPRQLEKTEVTTASAPQTSKIDNADKASSNKANVSEANANKEAVKSTQQTKPTQSPKSESVKSAPVVAKTEQVEANKTDSPSDSKQASSKSNVKSDQPASKPSQNTKS